MFERISAVFQFERISAVFQSLVRIIQRYAVTADALVLHLLLVTLPAVILGILGAFALGLPGFLLGFLIVYGTLITTGLIVVRQNQSINVERFGARYCVHFAGWHVLLWRGFIDVPTKSPHGHLPIPIQQIIAIPIFGEAGEKIDFVDDTAGVIAKLLVTVGKVFHPAKNGVPAVNPEWDVNTEQGRQNLTDSVWLYVYGAAGIEVGGTKEIARSIVDEAFRPLLQGKEVDAALRDKTQIAEAMQDFTGLLADQISVLGLFLAEKKFIAIGDFDLSAESVKLRQQVQAASKNVVIQEKAGEAARKFIEQLQARGGLSLEKATELYRMIQAMNGVQNMGARVVIGGQTSLGVYDAVLGIQEQGANNPGQRQQQRRNT